MDEVFKLLGKKYVVQTLRLICRSEPLTTTNVARWLWPERPLKQNKVLYRKAKEVIELVEALKLGKRNRVSSQEQIQMAAYLIEMGDILEDFRHGIEPRIRPSLKAERKSESKRAGS